RIVNGDGLCIKTPSGQILGMRANSCTGDLVTTNEKFRIFLNSTIYRNYNFEFEKELEKNLPQRFIPYDIIVTPEEHSINIKCAWPEDEIWEFDIAAEGSEAEKPEFAKQNIIRQLSKNSGAYKFNVTDVCGNKMFFYSAASLNGVRRMLAEKIAAAGVDVKWESSANFQAAQKLAAAALKNYSDGANGLTYMANSSNKLSGEIYKGLGFSKIAPAFELQQPKDGVLMRTKYCIRYQLGMCKKKLCQKNEKLYLLNGKNRLELEFDCTACEMLIKKSNFAAKGKKE
ncbi:MAG TPA: DUF3656 domain-containing protein, partial [Candidatus Egerieousia sp.]|nr:DUF3656 domain-containing protein [Candidatus Egerieousia sp.]